MIDLHPHHPSHPGTLADQLSFREARRDGIYSTDTPAILGLSRWGTPLSVYRDKTEPVPEPGPVSLQAWLGWRLESSLALLYEERYGVDVVAAPLTYSHPELPWLKTHLDYRELATGIIVECKTRDHFSSEWGEDGSSKVPVDIWVQCQHEMLVTAAEHCRVAVLFGLRSFRVYELPRDDGFLGPLVPRLSSFWDDVQAGRPPAITGHHVDTAWAKRHRQVSQSLRQATPEQERLMERRRLAGIVVSQAKAAQEELDNQLRELIKGHAGLQSRFGKVTWTTSKGRVDWERTAGDLQAIANELLDMAAPGDDPDRVARLAHIQSYLPLVRDLHTGEGTRSLNVRLKEWSDDDE